MTTPGPHRGLPPVHRRASRRGPWAWLVSSLVVVVAAAVAIPLALGGGGHQRAGQHGRDPGASAKTSGPAARGTASWQVPRDESLDGKNSWILNSYVAAHQVIVVSAQVIAGYDQHSGRRLWRVKPPPASGYQGNGPAIFCGASSALSGAMLAVAFGKRGQCALVAAIDVSAGRVAWVSQILPPGTATTLTLDAVLVEAAGPAVVVGFSDQIGAFSLTGGKFLGWHFTLSRTDPRYRERDTCDVTDLLNAGDAQHVYFTDRCALSGVVQYGVVDTATATMRGSSVMPGTVPFKLDRGDLVSVNPLVILLRADGLSRGEYLFFDAGSRLVAKRPSGRLSVADINFGLPPGDFHRRWRAITDGRTLVTVTDARADRANKLVAVDAATGRTRWSVSLAGAHVYTPVAFDGRQVLVAAATHAGRGALEVVRVDLATGKAVSATASTRAPFTGNPNLGAVTQFGWGNGQVFGIPTAHATLLGPIEGPAAFALG